MALDRTEVKAEIAANNVPTVTNAIMNTMLQNNLADNLVFRKDEKSSASGAGLATYTANFGANEQVILTGVNQNIAMSFSNLVDGDVRYLYITKGATNVVSFTVALDYSQNREYINSQVTSVLYRVTYKNAIVFVEAVYSPADNAWNSLTLLGSWTGFVKYRYNNFTGKVELYFNCTTTSTTDYSIGNLPAAYYPSTFISLLVPINGILGGTDDIGARLNVSSINGLIQVISKRPFTLVSGVYSLDGLADYYKTLP